MEDSKCINLNISKLEDEFALTIAWSNCLLTIAYYQANLSPSQHRFRLNIQSIFNAIYRNKFALAPL